MHVPIFEFSDVHFKIFFYKHLTLVFQSLINCQMSSKFNEYESSRYETNCKLQINQ